MKEALSGSAKHKYQKLFEALKADILSGRFKPGQKMPSEAALVNKSGASRITVGRAIRELQAIGLVDRVAGSGTYVKDLTRNDHRARLFGLLIPDLGDTEIFEPICQGIANSPEARDHALLWGHSDPSLRKSDQAWRLCQQYIARKVSGVFFAPLEFEIEAEKVNRRIVAAFREAHIALVLLDRRTSNNHGRDRSDLVGLNNRQAGYIATEHLIKLGCNRIGFLGHHGALSTIEERSNGYREALAAYGLRSAIDVHFNEEKENLLSLSPRRKSETLDAFVCLNDRVAGQLMHLFLARKMKVPQDIRIVGIDDVSYASLLPVPLTTVRQPTHEIGELAMRTMLDRIHAPHLQPREVLLDGQLIIRRSCGAGLEL